MRDRVRWLPVAPTRLRLAWRGHHFPNPEAAIIGLEPHPDTFSRLCGNVRGLANVTVRQEAGAGRNGRAFLASSPFDYIIATDNGSRDGTREILQRYADAIN